MRIDWFARPKARRHAQEEARYALREHGDRAEAVLRAKMERTESEDRRQIYRLALKALHQLR
jgi:hypothetical protein